MMDRWRSDAMRHDCSLFIKPVTVWPCRLFPLPSCTSALLTITLDHHLFRHPNLCKIMKLSTPRSSVARWLVVAGTMMLAHLASATEDWSDKAKLSVAKQVGCADRASNVVDPPFHTDDLTFDWSALAEGMPDRAWELSE